MRRNISIDFTPKITYKEYIFSNNPSKETEYFCREQLENKLNSILDKIPYKILNRFEKEGWEIIITNRRNLEEELGYSYKIYGCTFYEKKQAIVYANKYGIESIPHEIAHFLDTILNITNTDEWLNIYLKERIYYESNQLKEYFTGTDSKEECFADAFLLFILNKELLKNIAPKTFNVINNLFTYINYLI